MKKYLKCMMVLAILFGEQSTLAYYPSGMPEINPGLSEGGDDTIYVDPNQTVEKDSSLLKRDDVTLSQVMGYAQVVLDYVVIKNESALSKALSEAKAVSLQSGDVVYLQARDALIDELDLSLGEKDVAFYEATLLLVEQVKSSEAVETIYTKTSFNEFKDKLTEAYVVLENLAVKSTEEVKEMCEVLNRAVDDLVVDDLMFEVNQHVKYSAIVLKYVTNESTTELKLARMYALVALDNPFEASLYRYLGHMKDGLVKHVGVLEVHFWEQLLALELYLDEVRALDATNFTLSENVRIQAKIEEVEAFLYNRLSDVSSEEIVFHTEALVNLLEEFEVVDYVELVSEYIAYANLVVKYEVSGNTTSLKAIMASAESALKQPDDETQRAHLDELKAEMVKLVGGKDRTFYEAIIQLEAQIMQAESVENRGYTDRTWFDLVEEISVSKNLLENPLRELATEQVKEQIIALVKAVESLVEYEVYYRVNSDQTVTKFEETFDPTTVSDGFYQVHQGYGWIRHEDDLITSAVVEGEGTDNLVVLSRSAYATATHSFSAGASAGVEIKNVAQIGVSAAFGWAPPQTISTVTASMLMPVGEDATLVARLYVMSEKVETYQVKNGYVVSKVESFNPYGTVGLYGENSSAKEINILDYYIKEPVKVELGTIQSHLDSTDSAPADDSETEYDAIFSPGDSEDDDVEIVTPMYLAENVLGVKESETVQLDNATYIKVEEDDVTATPHHFASHNVVNEATDLADGTYTRFLGSGWVIGGEGLIGFSSAMPNAMTMLTETVQHSYKVTHTVGIVGSVGVEFATAKASASVQANYEHSYETSEATTIEVRALASSFNEKHISAYENNLKYEVIEVLNGEIVLRSNVYESDGMYVAITEDEVVKLADDEEVQVFNSLVESSFQIDLSRNVDVYLDNMIDTANKTIFNEKNADFTHEDTLNVHFRAAHNGVYKFRVNRVYGYPSLKDVWWSETKVRDIEHFYTPDTFKIYGLDNGTGDVIFEEYYTSSRGETPIEGGAYDEVYLQAGQDYVITIGASTMTEPFKVRASNGIHYTVSPADMFGFALETEYLMTGSSTTSSYLNSMEQYELKVLLEQYNTYEASEYLKESFVEFESARQYANLLRNRGIYANPLSLINAKHNLEEAAKKLIHLDDYVPPMPDIEIEYEREDYYVFIDPVQETTSKVLATDVANLEDGVYMIDRGYGYIRNDFQDLISTAVVDSDTDLGYVDIAKSVSSVVSHEHTLDVYSGVTFAKIFTIGLTAGFGVTDTTTRTLTYNHRLEVGVGEKGYLKVYTVNNKYETFEVYNGAVVSHTISYDPIGTIGLVKRTDYDFINEGQLIISEEINLFENKDESLSDDDLYNLTELSMDDVLEDGQSMLDEFEPVTYKVDKTVAQLNAGQIPQATLVDSDAQKEDGLYLTYVGDGFINGEQSFLNTMTTDPLTTITLETTSGASSYIQAGEKIEIELNVSVFEATLTQTFSLLEASGESLIISGSAYDKTHHAQLKIYEMYKKYMAYEMKDGNVVNTQYLNLPSGIYAKTFEPSDYSAALSEERERNTLTTAVTSLDEGAKSNYTGGADSIVQVNVLSDGSLSEVKRMGFSLDTDISTLPNGMYLIDLGDNWITSEVSDLIGSNINVNLSTIKTDATMTAVLAQSIETEVTYAGTGSGSPLGGMYNNTEKKRRLGVSISAIVGGGDTVSEGSTSLAQFDIPANTHGAIKLYTSSRRTDLVEIKNGQIVDCLTTYTPNGVQTVTKLVDKDLEISTKDMYISSPTKETLSEAGLNKLATFNQFVHVTPYLDLDITGVPQLTTADIMNNDVLMSKMYNESTKKLMNGMYSFYLGDWYVGDEITMHYVTKGSIGELDDAITRESVWSHSASAGASLAIGNAKLSIGGTFNKEIVDAKTITSGIRGFSYSNDNMIRLNELHQKFLVIEIFNEQIVFQTVLSELIGTSGSIQNTY